jgi:hypothetical protein
MRWFVLIGLVLLTACGSVYKSRSEEFVRTQPESAWGARPSEGHVQAEIEWIKSQLKDPYTADLRSAGCRRRCKTDPLRRSKSDPPGRG